MSGRDDHDVKIAIDFNIFVINVCFFVFVIFAFRSVCNLNLYFSFLIKNSFCFKKKHSRHIACSALAGITV